MIRAFGTARGGQHGDATHSDLNACAGSPVAGVERKPVRSQATRQTATYFLVDAHCYDAGLPNTRL